MPNKAEKRKLEPQPAPVEAEAQKQPERVAEYKRILIANCQDDLKRKAISRAIERVDHFSLNLISSDFVNAATHIVAVSLSPTEKIFGAIAAGIWLLRIDWVTQSWRHNRVWQPEDRFSFDSDPTTIRDDAKSLVAAWRRNFERRRRNEPKVFAVDSFKAVAVLSADSPVHRRIVESARRILFAGGAHCKRGVTAANVSHPAVHSSLSLVLVVDNENEAPLLKPSVVQTLLSAGIPVLSCDEIKTIIIHDAPRHLRTLLNLSIDYWSNRFNTVHGKAAYPLFCHKFEPPSQKGATTMSAAPHVIDLIDTSISPEKSSTHYNYNDMIDLASSSGSSAKPSRSRGSTIDLVSSSGSSRNSSVPLGQCKSTTGTIDLMSRASTSSNEDVRVVELTGAKDGADEGSKRDLVIPEPYTPLIRRLSSLELKGKNLSAKQDLKSPRSFVGYEGLAWLLEENDDDRDLSWFATNGNLVALCKALKKNEAQKGTQSQSGRSVDHFESLMAEVASYAGGDTPTLLSLDAVSFLRASLCSSNGTFKPTRNVLRRVYNQIAMDDRLAAASDAAFDFLRAMLRYWPPGSLAMRMHWLLVLTEVDFYVAGNPSEQLRVLVEHFHAKFANLIAALGSSRLSIIQMVMLVELFELDLANHAVMADPSSASNKLDAIPFVLYAVVGASASSGAFFTTHLKRIFDISALMSRTEDATVRQLCGRLLAACFEAQRLVQEGCVRLTDVKSVPVDLRRNVEDLSTKFVDDFGVENAAFAFHLPSQWLQQLVFEQMCARLCVSPTATPKWLIKSE